MKTTKANVQSFVRQQLGSNKAWAVKGMVRIFKENQTADEQTSEITKHNNGIGFTGLDAQILSSFSQQVLNGRDLSEKQLKIAFKLMPKYARQVVAFSDVEKLNSMVEKA